jgi:glycosyltransferase involved in cell wall biosynthesis
MSVLYLLTAPPPPFAGTDAVYQDVAILRDAFPGEVINLAPVKSSVHRVPKQFYGFHKIRQIRAAERRCEVNQLFFSLAYPFPVLRFLRNPLFYTITASLDVTKRPSNFGQLAKLARIIVSNERDASVLRAWGLTNYSIVPPAIDTTQIKRTPLLPSTDLTLLMASAPWNHRQFQSKGIDLLLATAASLPFLRLILVWRGVLVEELIKRVERFRIEKRVDVIDSKVNMADYLSRAHATVVFAENGGLVKSFPHSLLESLVAGKPVLLNNTIAMADYVNHRQCGIVISSMTVPALGSAIETLRRNYQLLARHAAQTAADAFSVDAMVDNYRRVYGFR